MEPETLDRLIGLYPLRAARPGESAREALERRVAWLRTLYNNDKGQRALSTEERRKYRVEAALDDLSPQQRAELAGTDLSAPWSDRIHRGGHR